MKRWTASTWALALVLLSGQAVLSQEPTAVLSRPSRIQLVRFEIIRGRLTATANGQTQARSASSADPSGCPSESLSVTLVGDKPTVHYERTDETQQVSLDVLVGSEVRLTREPRGADRLSKVAFEQVPGKELKLSVESGGTVKTCVAAGIWHLILEEPELCREHLLPVLAQLRSDWRLAEQAEAIERALVESCQAGVIERRARCSSLVDQLGSGTFQARRDAERELRAMGQVVTDYIGRLDPTRLDAEQRRRLRRLVDDLSVSTGDTPERAAMWLLDDRAIWLGLLSHERPDYRHMAALQLGRICNRPIEFDPAAAEIERRAQIERLRERLAKGL